MFIVNDGINPGKQADGWETYQCVKLLPRLLARKDFSLRISLQTLVGGIDREFLRFEVRSDPIAHVLKLIILDSAVEEVEKQ